jgi:putative flippase GtrA
VLVRFCSVGVVNTLLGLTVIWSAMHWLGLSSTAANALGYAVGIFVSFILNRRWTFRSAAAGMGELPRWLLLSGVGYIANLTTLTFIEALGANGYVAQLPAMATYTAVTYIGSRRYVFGKTAKG